MHRDQLQVETMRPRVLSDPVSRPSSTDRSAVTPLKSFHISRRGKLLCHDAGGAPTRDRSVHRRRAASASSCDLSSRRRRASAVRLCEHHRPSTPSSHDLARVQQTPDSLTFYRVMVAGSSGVGKSTVLTQLVHAAYAGEVSDTPQGSNNFNLSLFHKNVF